jgi:sarcosine/dimethylglycine N-methyltransferase
MSEAAKVYYDSDDADNFYYAIWGGTDIHIGLYERPDEPIFDASRRTVSEMASLIPFPITPKTKILDIGAGYGGASRYFAKSYGCPVVCLNLSGTQNKRNVQMCAEEDLLHLVTVVEGNFECMPFPDQSFDVVWSQDAILHSAHKDRIFAEVSRVLRRGPNSGVFVFSDIVAASETVPQEKVAPLLERIHLKEFGCDSLYARLASAVGMRHVKSWPHPEAAERHYTRVREELERLESELVASGRITQQYANAMKRGLTQWVQGFREASVSWGFFMYALQQ